MVLSSLFVSIVDYLERIDGCKLLVEPICFDFINLPVFFFFAVLGLSRVVLVFAVPKAIFGLKADVLLFTFFLPRVNLGVAGSLTSALLIGDLTGFLFLVILINTVWSAETDNAAASIVAMVLPRLFLDLFLIILF